MKGIREPSDQYGSPEKEIYRKTIWDLFKENLDAPNAVVLFLPSKYGYEIPLALERGFREENLIACDYNAGVIASAKWRKDYPKVRCYGTSVSRTIERLDNDGIILDAANLDYCSNICHQVLSDLTKLRTYRIIKPKDFILGITVLKGRETEGISDVAKLVFNDKKTGTMNRVEILKSHLKREGPTVLLNGGEYGLGKKKMCYGVFKLKEASKKKRREIKHKSRNVDKIGVFSPLSLDAQMYLITRPLFESDNETLKYLNLVPSTVHQWRKRHQVFRQFENIVLTIKGGMNDTR